MRIYVYSSYLEDRGDKNLIPTEKWLKAGIKVLNPSKLIAEDLPSDFKFTETRPVF